MDSGDSGAALGQVSAGVKGGDDDAVIGQGRGVVIRRLFESGGLTTFDANDLGLALRELDSVFQKAMTDALAFVNANPEAMITFGIKPTFPATQLGYIQLGEESQASESTSNIYTVDSFKEKPDLEAAEEYVKSGKYCWN